MEWERTGNNQEAVVTGVRRAASVITAAAAIMVTVFTAFTLAKLMEVKELGFSLWSNQASPPSAIER